MATNGNFSQQEQHKPATEQYPATSGATEATSGSGNGDISKDEVGWYFVEQYYTTLSKSPEKLHLFYGKRSQFVSGVEGGINPVSVGRSAIQERIRELEFQDCKVRISNVDSQASFDNIVIQVIGETSNNSAELKKFVQTFVLAQQPSGYFVLNDIFRYIKEEVEEEVADAAPQEETAQSGPLVEDVEMPSAPAAAEESAPLNADVVDKKLEETIEAEETAPPPATNGTPAEAAPEPEASAVKSEVPTPEVIEKSIEEESQSKEEIPKDPEPTRAVTPQPPKPAQPPKPLSWASRAAAAAASTSAPKPAVPAVAVPKASATPPAQSRPAQQTSQSQKPAQAAPAAATPESKEGNSPTSAGWQTAGSDHTKRQNRPQSVSGPPEKEGTMGYVRNVTEKVVDADLRATLSSFGSLIYFDINRGKNCAFVEYASAEGYNAAAAANPHQVSGETIYVEPRRPKANAYGGNGYSRGGLNNRGRGGFQQGRPGQQDNRGNFGQNRGRGGGAARGRGTAQTAA